MFSQWLEARGQNPRTFGWETLFFFGRFFIAIMLVTLPFTIFAYFTSPATPPGAARTVSHRPTLAELPPYFWLFFGMSGLYMFCAVAGIVALVGSWHRLARKFAAPRHFSEGQLFKRQSGAVGVAGYNGILTVRVTSQGLYLATTFPFTLMHPALLIPWPEIKARWQRRFFGRHCTYLIVGSPKLATISLMNPKIIEVAEASLPPISRSS